MPLHLLKEHNQLKQCNYCFNEINDLTWESNFHGHFHYKTTICPNCGTKSTVKVNFQGSGHDDWDGKLNKRLSGKIAKSQLEKKVIEVEERNHSIN